MELYTAFDLHANNTYVAIIDHEGNRVAKKKLPTDSVVILDFLRPHREHIFGIVVESTYNWYWIVDTLVDAGYKVHLANTAAIKKYKDLKHSDDKEDAFWLAEMLRLDILPEGHIYPKEGRAIRDLLRKRGHLVKLRTSLILSLQNIIVRNCGVKIDSNDIKRLKEDRVTPLLKENEDLALSGKITKESIDFLTSKIRASEYTVECKVRLKDPYEKLLTIPGIGKVLGLTIMLETGSIDRFQKVGNYVSYCRKVSSRWTSNEKAKGSGNKKNGNKYLAWAFSEAAELARRYDPPSRAYYNRKMQKTNFMVAQQCTGPQIGPSSLSCHEGSGTVHTGEAVCHVKQDGTLIQRNRWQNHLIDW